MEFASRADFAGGAAAVGGATQNGIGENAERNDPTAVANARNGSVLRWRRDRRDRLQFQKPALAATTITVHPLDISRLFFPASPFQSTAGKRRHPRLHRKPQCQSVRLPIRWRGHSPKMSLSLQLRKHSTNSTRMQRPWMFSINHLSRIRGWRRT